MSWSELNHVSYQNYYNVHVTVLAATANKKITITNTLDNASTGQIAQNLGQIYMYRYIGQGHCV